MRFENISAFKMLEFSQAKYSWELFCIVFPVKWRSYKYISGSGEVYIRRDGRSDEHLSAILGLSSQICFLNLYSLSYVISSCYMTLYIIFTQVIPKCMYRQSIHLPKFQNPIFICLIEFSPLRFMSKIKLLFPNVPQASMPGNGNFPFPAVQSKTLGSFATCVSSHLTTI